MILHVCMCVNEWMSESGSECVCVCMFVSFVEELLIYLGFVGA